MGIRLSSSGGLTLSQKKGKTKEQQTELLKKLSKMEINQPILKKVAEAKKKREEAAAKRRAEAAEKITEDAVAQESSSSTSKKSKK